MSSQPNNHDGLASYTQYMHNKSITTSSKPSLCDVIYIYCKVTLPLVENQEELERLVHAYVLLMQKQQASDDEIYEG